MEQQRRPVALVTGGRQGLGRGCALALADRGFDLIIVDLHDDETSKETLSLLEAKGAKAHFLQCDISDVDGHAALVDAAWALFGGIECVVNNAGVAPRQLSNVLTLTPDDYDFNTGINLRGNFFFAQAVAQRMVEAKPGPHYRSMVFISSIAANHVSVDIPEYCISKAGLSMVAGLFAGTLVKSGIIVHEIRPGFINTAMTASEGAPREAIDAHIRDGHVPMNRWGEESDVGRTVATLAAGELPYSIGHPVYVDGGYGIRTA